MCRFRLLGICAVAALMLLGCSAGESKHQEIVKLRLNDPDSAQFRNVKQNPNDKDVWCGELNAKNKLGGYVGFSRYVMQTIGFDSLKASEVFVSRFLVDGKDGEFSAAWRLFCE